MPLKLLNASLDELAKWPESISPFSAWLHFEREWRSSDEHPVSKIIESGCRLLMTTGPYSYNANDQIDWIIPGITKDIVLTLMADEINEQAAFELLATSCPNGKSDYVVISAFTDDLATEMNVIVKIRKAIEFCEAAGLQGLR